MNITKCKQCNTDLIAEDIAEHQCRKLTDFWIIDGIIWLGDGKQYYPLKFNNWLQQRKNQHNHDFGSVRFLVGFEGCSAAVGKQDSVNLTGVYFQLVALPTCLTYILSLCIESEV
jgi:hypothetical protein